jgi:predicted alpha/beta superfamily hydrolase
MKPGAMLAASTLFLFGAIAASFAAEPASAPPSSPVTLPGASQFDLPSQIAGRTYRIFVYKPLTPPPASGYPVIYVTDGNGMFPLAAGQMSLLALAGKGAMVIGVGYPTDDFMKPMMLRYRDLTPATEDQTLFPTNPPLAEADQGGKSELFYRFLVEELRPVLLRSYPINPHEQSLYGHSLGGLFVLNVMFKHPDAFNSYVASSPSIWWDKRSVLKGEAEFVAKLKTSKAPLRVLICVGAKEQNLYTSAPPGQPMSLADINKRVAEARMVVNARELANRLMQIDARPDLVVRFQDFSAEDHISVVPASISRALLFAIEP